MSLLLQYPRYSPNTYSHSCNNGNYFAIISTANAHFLNAQLHLASIVVEPGLKN